MRWKILAIAVAALFVVGTAYAQEGRAGAGRIEVGAFPGGGMFFTQSSSGNEPDFGNYALAASFAVNVNRWIGFEAEGGGTVGVHQTLTFNENTLTNQRSPSMWGYSGNLVVHPGGNDHAVVPYLTGGVGGLTLTSTSDVENLGITSNETFLTGNVGGGIKWFSTRNFGLRADYRFLAVNSKDTAPQFFGTENRYGHRVQAGLIFTY